MVKRKKFSSFTRERVGHRQAWTCNTCQCTLHPSFHVDHVIPLVSGGSNDDDNLQALCYICHTAKTAFESRLRNAKKRERELGQSRFFDLDSYMYLPQVKRRKVTSQ